MDVSGEDTSGGARNSSDRNPEAGDESGSADAGARKEAGDLTDKYLPGPENEKREERIRVGSAAWYELARYPAQEHRRLRTASDSSTGRDASRRKTRAGADIGR